MLLNFKKVLSKHNPTVPKLNFLNTSINEAGVNYLNNFKSIDEKNNYSESGIITRKTGELIHEVTKNIKSENAEKYISIYLCKNYDKKV